MKDRYISVLILFLLVFQFAAFSQSASFQSEGENLFKQNRPEESIPLLEEEINNGTASAQAYNYLGLAYYQIGEYEKSVEIFAKGLKTSGTNKKILSFNQGNSYYLMQDYENAVKSYSLAISADSSFSSAVLNRANSYLMQKKFGEASDDYKKFLVLEPDSNQRDSIEEVLSLLQNEIQRQEEEKRIAELEAERLREEERRMEEELERQRIEQERLAEEARKERERLEEEARIAREKEEAEQRRIEEEKRAAEAERRRKLLEEVANSLQDTNSTNMTAGSGDVMDYDFESELD